MQERLFADTAILPSAWPSAPWPGGTQTQERLEPLVTHPKYPASHYPDYTSETAKFCKRPRPPPLFPQCSYRYDTDLLMLSLMPGTREREFERIADRLA